MEYPRPMETQAHKKEIDPSRVIIEPGAILGIGYGSIHADEQTDQEAMQRADIMRGYFVEVDPEQASDCIDGRHSRTLLNGSLLDLPRPGVAGGAAVTGYAAAELIRYFGESTLQTQSRFEEVVERLESDIDSKPSIRVGGHVDEDAVDRDFSDGKTGCGAADKLIGNIEFLSTLQVSIPDGIGGVRNETNEEVEARIQAVKDLTKAVVSGSGYFSEFNNSLDTTINDIITTATQLSFGSELQGWQGVVMKDVLESKGQDRIVVLDTTGGGVHGHTERKVLFNLIEKTTFDQDGYSDAMMSEEGEGRQVFDVDVWHIRDIAEALANSPDESQAAKLFTAGVAFQIATYLGLCDGSHRPFFATAA